MFKFLRKYNKWILAIGGTLLMIVFLIPQALEGLAQQAGVGRAERAVLGPEGQEERILARDWLEYRQEAEVIRRLEQRGGSVIPWIERIEGTEHWFLLVREAQQAGLVGSPRALSLTPQQRLELESVTGMRGDVLGQTLARIDGVTRMLQMYRDAGHFSDMRMRNFAARAFHSVDTQMVVLHADADAVDVEPSEDEIREQFEKYRDDVRGEGEMGFGYRLPHRVKLEWLAIPVESIRDHVRESDEMDGVALRRHWRRDPGRMFPDVDPSAPVPDEVHEHLLTQLVRQKTEEISRFAHDTVRAARRGLEQRRGYYVLPDDWEEQRQSFPVLAQLVQERFGIELPEYHAIGDRWLSIEELDDLNGIGRATTDLYGRQRLGLSDVVPAARELDGSLLVQMQKGVAGPVLTGTDRSIYLFRITDVDAARPAESVDEVRDDVVHDLKRLAHYNDLKERLSFIESVAAEQGMLGLSLEFDTEVFFRNVSLADERQMQLQVQRGESPRLQPTPLPVIGEHMPTSEAIIDRARALPYDTPLSEIASEDRTFVLSVDDHLVLLATRIERQSPLSEEDYRELASFNVIRTLMLTEELGGVEEIRQVFSFNALAERHHFRRLEVDDDDLDDDLLEDETVAQR